MPAFNETHPRVTVSVLEDMGGPSIDKGTGVTIPNVYAGGHVLTTEEADYMNARMRSTMVNGYGGDIRRGLTQLDDKNLALFLKKEWPEDGATSDKRWDGKAWKYKTEDGKEHTLKTGPKAATIEDLAWDHQAKLDEKFAAYKPGGSNNAREVIPADPIEAAARQIAIQEVKDLIINAGRKVKHYQDARKDAQGNEYPEGNLFNQQVALRLEKHKDRIYEAAKAQVEGRPEADTSELADLPPAVEAGTNGEAKEAA